MSSLSEDIYYNKNVRQIIRTEFSVASPDRIKEKSVADVYQAITSDTNTTGTVRDQRMGVTERGDINPITKLNYVLDPGNFGHLELVKPCIQVHHYKTIIKIMNCVCCVCSSLLIDDPADEQKNWLHAITKIARKNRLKYLEINQFKNTKPKYHCPQCGILQPKTRGKKGGVLDICVNFDDYVKDKDRVTAPVVVPTAAISSVKTKGQSDEVDGLKRVSYDYVYEILQNISMENADLMGIKGHPSWLFWTVFPICPSAMRPSVRQDGGKVADDDLTHKTIAVIKCNAQLREKLNAKTTTAPDKANESFDEMWAMLQLHCATYIDNTEKLGIQLALNRSNRPLKTLRQRIEAKDGRIRNNLMGKRVDLSGRSVITGDPNISIDEAGIPLPMALNMTYPELVNEYNIDQLRTLVNNGYYKHPGVKRIVHTEYRNGKMVKHVRDLRFIQDRSSIRISNGDVVYRHVMDGDPIIMNRQPSLHKMSMMCHRVRVLLEGLSLRLNINATKPYNADFDGDEMNVHLPKSLQTCAEAIILMKVGTQIVSPQASKPVIGLVQDSLLGMYRMSKKVTDSGKNSWLSYNQFMRVVGWLRDNQGDRAIPPPHFSEEKGYYWTNNDLINTILPKLNLAKYDRNEDGSSTKVLDISNGVLNTGIIDKRTMGATSNSLIHLTWLEFGPEITRRFCDDLMNLTSQWLCLEGFSVGLNDMIIPTVNLDNNKLIHDVAMDEVKQTIKDFHIGNYHGEFATLPYGKSNRGEQLESVVRTQLDKMYSTIQSDTVKTMLMDDNNRIVDMVVSGSKGDKTNMARIASLIGQQVVTGGRIPNSYFERPIQFFPKYCVTPESRGFISSSLLKGLTPSEYVYFAMAGREGIISTSIKTAQTGYLQRKFIKIMEDLRVAYDGSVRNASDKLIQAVYGNGIDGSYSKTLSNRYLCLSDEEFSDQYHWNMSSHTKLQDACGREWASVSTDRSYIHALINKGSTNTKISSPIDIKRMIDYITGQFNTTPRPVDGKLTKLDRSLIITFVNGIDELIENFSVSTYAEVNTYTLRLFHIYVRSIMNSKYLYYRGFNEVTFVRLLEEIKLGFGQSVINPGENTGVIAAQSLGEPATQMTLNVFHSAGVGSKANVSGGIPRLSEIIDIARNPKTPSITAAIKDSFIKTHVTAADTGDISAFRNKITQQAMKVKSSLEYKTIRDIARNTKIIFDPIGITSAIPEDRSILEDLMNDDYVLADDIKEINESGPWVIRIEFNRDAVYNADVDMIAVKLLFDQLSDDMEPKIKTRFISQFSSTYDQTLFARIRFSSTIVGDKILEILTQVSERINDLNIKGVGGIDSAEIRLVKNTVINKDGRVIGVLDNTECPDIIYQRTGCLIDTNGSNLIDVLSMPHINARETVSNNIREIYEVLGVEAARECISREMLLVLETAGASVSMNHIKLLSDAMTSQGILMSVARHGMKKGSSGPWARSSFEETVPQLTDAALYGEVDNMRGVSANIMFGQFIKSGTNAFEVIMDENMIIEHDKRITEEVELSVHNEIDLAQCINDQFDNVFQLS